MARLSRGMVGASFLFDRAAPDIVLLFQLLIDQFQADGTGVLTARFDTHGIRLRLPHGVITLRASADPIDALSLTGLWRPDPHHETSQGVHPDVVGIRLARRVVRHQSCLFVVLSSRDLGAVQPGETGAPATLLETLQSVAAILSELHPVSAVILHPQMLLLCMDEVLDGPLPARLGCVHRKPITLVAKTRPRPALSAAVQASRPVRPRHRHSTRSAGRLFTPGGKPMSPALPHMRPAMQALSRDFRAATPRRPTPRPLAWIARLAVGCLYLALVPGLIGAVQSGW